MKTVLITGGSNGIGLEIAKRFAQANYRVILVSLLTDELVDAKAELETLYPNAEILAIQKDLARLEAAEEVYNWVKEHEITLDVLVNNAGFGTFGYAQDIDLAREQNMLLLNVYTVFSLTKYFLKEMTLGNKGTIINISSNSSFSPIPKLAAYSATKAFVSHYSQAVSHELKKQGSRVKILTVCPSAISDTAFKDSNDMQKVHTFKGLAFTTKKEVADDVWSAFLKGRSFQISGWKMRLLRIVQKLSPPSINYFFIWREVRED